MAVSLSFPSDAKRPEYRRRWLLAHPEKARAVNQRCQNRQRDARRTFGLCPLCGHEAEVDRTYCEHHLELNRERMRRRREARKKDQPVTPSAKS